MSITDYPQINSDELALASAIIDQEVKPRVAELDKNNASIAAMIEYGKQQTILENATREIQRWNDTKKAAQAALKAYGDKPDFSDALKAQEQNKTTQNLLSRALAFVKSMAEQHQAPESGTVAEWAAKALMSFSPTSTGNTASTSARDRVRSAQIREWAKGQPQFAGRVNTHGRIPQDITEAYDALHTLGNVNIS